MNGPEKRHLWKEVETIVLQEYELIQTLTMRNSYYHILPILFKKVGTDITEEQYQYFEGKYRYYQSDKWPEWEKRYNITRPTSKDPTIALYGGNQIVLAYITEKDFTFDRCQGFIFLEKSGFMLDLEVLSLNGWVVLAGEGFSTREIREQIIKKYSHKPILIVHDFDWAGNKMGGVFSNGSKRTKHLGLKFKNVIDLGLREEDVEELDLPIQPEARKYQDKQKWRVELNALTILIARDGIKTPLLWYITKRMFEEGIPLHEEEESSIDLLLKGVSRKFKDVFEEIVKDVIQDILQDVEEKTIIDIAIPTIDKEENPRLFILFKLLESKEITDIIRELGTVLIKHSEYIDEYETREWVLYQAGLSPRDSFERYERSRKKPTFKKE